jgi:hypothetical protein
MMRLATISGVIAREREQSRNHERLRFICDAAAYGMPCFRGA